LEYHEPSPGGSQGGQENSQRLSLDHLHSLTTLVTARVPGDHGVLGYNTFVKRLGGIVNSLRYTHPSSNIRDSLSNGVPFESAFPKAKGYLSQVEKGTAAVLPQGIENTEFTRVVHGKVEETRTYFNIWDAGNSLTALMGKGYRFIYAYIPDVDTLAHKYGPYDPSTLEAAREIFMKFYYALKKRGDYTALITADHGLIETDKVVEVRGEQELMSLLELPPYGDSRALFLKSRFDMKVFLSQRYNLKVYAGEEIPPLLGGITDREYLPTSWLYPWTRPPISLIIGKTETTESLKGITGVCSRKRWRYRW